MRRLFWAAVLLAGCSAGPGAGTPAPAAAGSCACTNKVCACAHCKPDKPGSGCPCRSAEQPR